MVDSIDYSTIKYAPRYMQKDIMNMYKTKEDIIYNWLCKRIPIWFLASLVLYFIIYMFMDA